VLFRETEVCELGMAILVQNYVLKLEIAEHDASCMQMLKS